MTREHLYRAKWVQIFGVTNTQTLARWGWERDADGSIVEFSKQWKGNAFDQPLKSVCADCNQGWMNDLENEVEPFLAPMVEGNVERLGVQKTLALGRWVVKTAVVRAYQGHD